LSEELGDGDESPAGGDHQLVVVVLQVLLEQTEGVGVARSYKVDREAQQRAG
jgi:hypothetical protein